MSKEMTKPTLEEQIEHMQEQHMTYAQIYGDSEPTIEAIIASLKELQSIRSAELPVETDMKWLVGFINSVPFLPGIPKDDIKKAHAIIDAIKSALQVAQQERDEALMLANSVNTYDAVTLQRAEKAESELAAMYKAAEEEAGHEMGLWTIGAVATVGRLKDELAALRGRLKDPTAEMCSAGQKIIQSGIDDPHHIFTAMSAVALKEGK